jgi:hypothetical protein
MYVLRPKSSRTFPERPGGEKHNEVVLRSAGPPRMLMNLVERGVGLIFDRLGMVNLKRSLSSDIYIYRE